MASEGRYCDVTLTRHSVTSCVGCKRLSCYTTLSRERERENCTMLTLPAQQSNTYSPIFLSQPSTPLSATSDHCPLQHVIQVAREHAAQDSTYTPAALISPLHTVLHPQIYIYDRFPPANTNFCGFSLCVKKVVRGNSVTNRKCLELYIFM